jgi:lysophospholipase L1-like esterase
MAQRKKRQSGRAELPHDGPADILAFPHRGPVPPAPLPLARRLAYFAVPFGLFFGLLAAVEVTVRATRRPVSTIEVFVQAPEQHRGFRDVHGVSVFEGDPMLFWRVAPNLRKIIWDFTPLSTNAQGLRYPRAVGAKGRDTFRVACFGDSVTFGYRVPVVWPERPEVYNAAHQPFSQLLEASLRQANPGRDIEVLPFAVPGYSSHQGLAWLRRDIEDVKPDVVVACYGWNDINRRARTDRATMSTAVLPVLFRRLTGYSQALLHVSARWQGLRGRGDAARSAVTRVPTAEYVENLREIVRLSQQSGAKAIVIAPFFRDAKTEPLEAQRMAEHRRALGQAMNADGTPYLEIVELTEASWPGNDALFGERIHPSWLGHRLIATRLAEALHTHHMLAGLEAPAPLPQS